MVLKKMGITPGANAPVVRQPTAAPATAPAPSKTTPGKTKTKTK
jgi:hypothetical protein